MKISDKISDKIMNNTDKISDICIVTATECGRHEGSEAWWVALDIEITDEDGDTDQHTIVWDYDFTTQNSPYCGGSWELEYVDGETTNSDQLHAIHDDEDGLWAKLEKYAYGIISAVASE